MKNVMLKTSVLCLVILFGVTAGAQQATVRAVLQAEGSRAAVPPFRLQDAHGKFVSPSELRGHVALLNFWATECGGCRTELPYFVEFDQKFRSKGLRTIGISMDITYEKLANATQGWARVNPFVRAHGIGYPILMADDAAEKSFDVVVMPATYLVDKRGRIAAKYVGIVDRVDVAANIQALLAER